MKGGVAVFATQNSGLPFAVSRATSTGLTCLRLDGFFVPRRAIPARQSRPLRMRVVGPPAASRARGGTASVRGQWGRLMPASFGASAPALPWMERRPIKIEASYLTADYRKCSGSAQIVVAAARRQWCE